MQNKVVRKAAVQLITIDLLQMNMASSWTDSQIASVAAPCRKLLRPPQD